MDQGTEDADPEILQDENLPVQCIGSCDVENRHVDHRDLETMDADQVAGNLGPVIRSDLSPVASEAVDFLYPLDMTNGYLCPGPSYNLRRIAAPMGL